uniref:Uncharacterized protein n=1 Tax=Callorhinchus milii TaxID=7868 RepID=A0A4W3JA50_CALMI
MSQSFVLKCKDYYYYYLIVMLFFLAPFRVFFPLNLSCFSPSRKYDSLIQAQARELSHLRQKMREGKSIGQILKQHLSDTTKSFEELLRANDIDYYMGQSFRDQLSQGCQMAEKVVHKLTGRKFVLFIFPKCRKYGMETLWLIIIIINAQFFTLLFPDNQSHSENPSQHSPFPSVNTSPCGAHPNSKPSMPSSQQPATDTAPAQKGTVGTDLLEEHLREIRSLRQRLEESICTNDRLRQQLEVRLAAAAKESGNELTLPHRHLSHSRLTVQDLLT